MVARRTARVVSAGGTIGVVAPSGPADPATLAAGMEMLADHGYSVRMFGSAVTPPPDLDYLAANDIDRAANLNSAFADPEVDLVLCAAGGYGCARIMDLVDWDMIAASGKLLAGYSDITTLHLGIARKTRLPSLHSPMVSSLARLAQPALDQFWSALERLAPLEPIVAPEAMVIRPGLAEGELAGGCLTLLAAACGTPWQPMFDGCIVLIEDVNEPTYRLDRCLEQLRASGSFNGVRGIVVGEASAWRQAQPERQSATPDALWRDRLGRLGVPVLAGVPFGHVASPITLPLGVRARLDTSARSITMLDSVFAAA